MRIVAAITGSLEEAMQAEADEGARAVTVAVTDTTKAAQGRLRQQVMGTLGSVRLANAWRSATDPRLPRTSFGAAGRIWSNAPHIIDAFSRSQAIRSPNGFYLAIPSPDAPERFMGKPVSPSNWPTERYGPLRFVYRRGGASLLVVDAVRRNTAGRVSRRIKNDGLTKSGRYAKGWSTVVMFYLVPMVRLPKHLDPQSVYDAAPAQIVDRIMAAWRD